MMDYAQYAYEVLARLRERNPRIHCITNFAAMNLTANMLLAIGATPSLSYAIDEVESFSNSADALLINLGTLDNDRKAAIPLALKAGKPWVLDPVFVHRSPPRLAFAKSLLGYNPTLIRGNIDEITALKPTGLIAQTGVIDDIYDDNRRIKIRNGNPLMAKVTAMGCAGTAIMAAALAVEPDPFKATVSSLLWLGIAGEMAEAKGPGSFQPTFLDALFALDETTIIQKARFS